MSECTGPFQDAQDCPVHAKDVKGKFYTESDIQTARAEGQRSEYATWQRGLRRDLPPLHEVTVALEDFTQAARVSAAGAQREQDAKLANDYVFRTTDIIPSQGVRDAIRNAPLATDDGAWLKAHDAAIYHDAVDRHEPQLRAKIQAEYDTKLAQHLAAARSEGFDYALEDVAEHPIALEVARREAAARLDEAKLWAERHSVFNPIEESEFSTNYWIQERIAKLEAKLAAGEQEGKS